MLCYNDINESIQVRRMTMKNVNGYGIMNDDMSFIDAAREETETLRDIRVMRAERSERGWRLKYVALDDDYPVATIERRLSRLAGESVRMINLHYDFDTTARLLYA
jgi:hypothetical protein